MGLSLGIGIMFGNQAVTGGAAAPAAATLNPTNGTNKHSNIVLANGNLTAAWPSGVGGNQFDRPTRHANTGTTQFEVTINVVSGVMAVTVEDGTGDFSAVYASNFGCPGNSDSKGISLTMVGNAFTIIANGGSVISNPSGTLAAGDIFTIVINRGAGSVQFYRNGTSMAAAVVPTAALSDFFGSVGGQYNGAQPQMTVNYAGPFSYLANAAY